MLTVRQLINQLNHLLKEEMLEEDDLVCLVGTGTCKSY